MDDDLQETLFQRYPTLYEFHSRTAVEYHLGEDAPAQPLTDYGITCGDGWFQILDAASRQLSHRMQKKSECDVRAVQVKQKAGELRFYVEPLTRRRTSPFVQGVIRTAEDLSRRVCAECGTLTSKDETTSGSGLCDDCRSFTPSDPSD